MPPPFAPAGEGHLRALLITLLVTGLVLLAWRIASVLLLAFGGVLAAVLLRHLALLLSRWTRLPVGASLAAVVIGLVLLGVLFSLSVGSEVAAQFGQLWDALPQALQRVQDFIAQHEWGREILAAGEPPRPGTLLSMATGVVGTLVGALGDALLVVVVALFLAADPRPYRRGLLHLIPLERRARAIEILDALDTGLWRWILGQSVAMLVVGTVTATGLWLLGIPLALALGILAGLLNVIPYLGPILSGAPAVLIAFAQSPNDALYTLLLFVLIQNLEGYVLTPMLQRRAVAIPPALGILTIVGLGSLFGAYGVLVATPLLLVIMILVKMIYVEDALGDRIGDLS